MIDFGISTGKNYAGRGIACGSGFSKGSGRGTCSTDEHILGGRSSGEGGHSGQGHGGGFGHGDCCSEGWGSGEGLGLGNGTKHGVGDGFAEDWELEDD